ncbi:MAG: hypothetical protein GY906_33865 [bacterium]|nr:hypothetical protein [bacterium]
MREIRTWRRTSLGLILATVLIGGCARSEIVDTLDVSGSYFSQTSPGLVPEVFAPGVFNRDYTDFNPVFGPDGKEFYFTSDIDGHYTIKVMRYIDGNWSEPETAEFSGTYQDCDMFITHNGRRMLYSSTRPLPGTTEPTEGLFIWSMEREEESWGEPRSLGPSVNSGGRSCYPTTTTAGTLYFQSSRETNIGEPDIHRASLVNGSYPVVENLGRPVNSEFAEMDNVIAPDESYLIVSCKRPGGTGGSDLYITFRASGGSWSEMINMGDRINTEHGEGCPMITHDGKYLFFISNRSGHDENYWVDAKVVEELRPRTFSD